MLILRVRISYTKALSSRSPLHGRNARIFSLPQENRLWASNTHDSTWEDVMKCNVNSFASSKIGNHPIELGKFEYFTHPTCNSKYELFAFWLTAKTLQKAFATLNHWFQFIAYGNRSHPISFDKNVVYSYRSIIFSRTVAKRSDTYIQHTLG